MSLRPAQPVRETAINMAAKKSTRSQGSQQKLLLVDDHPIWRDTLRNILTHAKVGTVVGEASDGGEAVDVAAKVAPDVVVMDVNLPTMDGIAATRLLLKQGNTKVLVLASSDDRAQVIDAVRAGASGYVLKTAELDEVVDAVRRIGRGELVFPPSVANAVLDELRESTDSLRVVVGDPTVLAREGLSRLLREGGFDVTGATGDPDELVAHVEEGSPDVVLLDAALTSTAPGMRARCPGVALLILAGAPDLGEIDELLRADARGIGYLLKERIENLDELADAIRRVARGESVVDPEIVGRLVRRPAQRRALDDLTPREIEVLSLMAEGHSNQAVVERLSLGPKTVEAHVRSIFTKLGLEQTSDVHRRVLAVITYLRHS